MTALTALLQQPARPKNNPKHLDDLTPPERGSLEHYAKHAHLSNALVHACPYRGRWKPGKIAREASCAVENRWRAMVAVLGEGERQATVAQTHIAM